MKKTILILVISLCSVVFVNAQPRAIGGRLGTNVEFSYQHALSGNTFIELDLGAQSWLKGVQAVAVHDWIFATPKWSPKGTWNWYAGVGAGLGYCWQRYYSDIYDSYHQSYFFVGISGQLGLSYTFWFPLQLSIDVRPLFGVAIGDMYNNRRGYYNVGFHGDGLYDAAFSVRYSF